MGSVSGRITLNGLNQKVNKKTSYLTITGKYIRIR